MIGQKNFLEKSSASNFAQSDGRESGRGSWRQHCDGLLNFSD